MAIQIIENPWDLFPEHRHLATEEAGNEIVCDTSVVGGGRVFGLWHDPAAIILLAESERDLTDRFGALPADGDTLELSPEVSEGLFENVQTFDALPEKDMAATPLGSQFAAWLADLPVGARIADLRAAKPGDGFEFGDCKLARHPEALVFALIVPEKKPGLLGRLFGR